MATDSESDPNDERVTPRRFRTFSMSEVQIVLGELAILGSHAEHYDG